MNISKGTIVRTIMLTVVIVNLALKAFGYDLIKVDEGSVITLVETAVELAVIAVAFWKNNSFSDAAIRADEFLRNLRDGGDENGEG